jgi:hypothetical protein
VIGYTYIIGRNHNLDGNINFFEMEKSLLKKRYQLEFGSNVNVVNVKKDKMVVNYK